MGRIERGRPNHRWWRCGHQRPPTATNGQHQVYFAADINVSNAVQITTPDGLLLKTRILGMSFYDSASDRNILFAELQDSTGQLVANNQVVYPNAFTDCDADVRYTYTRAGCEQDIVVQQQLATPDSFGLNPDTTWLQVWTEFTDPPSPTIEPILDGADVRLDFGMYKMERGKAFIMGNESNAVPVNKSWRTVEGRTFLVEQVRFDDVASQLQSLPAYSWGGGGSNGIGTQQIRFQGFPKKLPPVPTLAKRTSEKMKLADGSDNFTTSSSSVFTNAGAGAHYLAGSTYRGQGTTNIDANLLADLRAMTTYPPVTPASFTSDDIPTVTTNTTLVPYAIRDNTNATVVDAGYHYSPIDYMTTPLITQIAP